MTEDYFNVVDLMTAKVFSLVCREIQKEVFTATAQKRKVVFPYCSSCHLFSLTVKTALKLQV